MWVTHSFLSRYELFYKISNCSYSVLSVLSDHDAACIVFDAAHEGLQKSIRFKEFSQAKAERFAPKNINIHLFCSLPNSNLIEEIR